MFDLSSSQLRLDYIRKFVVSDRVAKGRLFPPAETVRGRGPKIFDLELLVDVDVNMEVRIKSQVFETRELLPRVFPEKSNVTFINFPEFVLLDDGSLRVGRFHMCEPVMSSSNLTSECLG